MSDPISLVGGASVCIVVLIAACVVAAVASLTARPQPDWRPRRVWIITGAARGIGAATASSAMATGAHVELWDLRPGVLAETLAALRAGTRGAGTASARVVDVSDAVQVRDAAAAALAEHGCIDVVVSNAGVVSGRDVETLSPADVARTFAVNVFAQFHILRELLPAAKARGSGCFVFIGSVMGCAGSARLSDYCASKWALQGMVESVRLELARDGLAARVPVILIRPYAVTTGMFAGIFEDPRSRNVVRSVCFPSLDARDVAAAAVAAVRAGRSAVITLPAHANLVLALGRALPLPLMDTLAGWMGGWHGMSGFHGRADALAEAVH